MNPTPTDPSPSALRVFLAESMGYKFTPVGERHVRVARPGVYPDAAPAIPKEAVFVVTPALTLDWLHECIRELLTTPELKHRFAVIIGMELIPMGWRDWSDTLAILSATEEQIALALYRTLAGKEGA